MQQKLRVLSTLSVFLVSISILSGCTSPAMQSGSATPTKVPLAAHGFYEQYSKAAVEQAQFTARHVVFFSFSPDCVECVALDKEITKRVTELPGDVSLFKVTTANEPAMAEKYGFTSGPEFQAVGSNGSGIKKWTSATFDDLLTQLQ